MSVFGTEFGTHLTEKLNSIGTEVGPYLLIVAGIIIGIIVFTFVMKFIRSRLGR